MGALSRVAGWAVARWSVVAVFGAVLALAPRAAGQSASGPPPGPQFLDQKDQQEQLLKHFASIVGQLTPEAERAFQRWESAVLAWQKEPESGAGAKLAAGVMYDCLTRLRNVWPPALSDAKDMLVWSIPEKRVRQAVDAFKAAIESDRALVEARFRLDRLRGLKDRSSVADLERLATEPAPAPYGYLAAMSRAEIASARHEEGSAQQWYARALELFPQSTAARVALSAFGLGEARPLEALPGEDPYYAYPCRVMTAPVANALAARMRGSASR